MGAECSEQANGLFNASVAVLTWMSGQIRGSFVGRSARRVGSEPFWRAWLSCTEYEAVSRPQRSGFARGRDAQATFRYNRGHGQCPPTRTGTWRRQGL
jgi:hypothetical protein